MCDANGNPAIREYCYPIKAGSLPQFFSGLAERRSHLSVPFRQLSPPLCQQAEFRRQTVRPIRQMADLARQTAESFRQTAGLFRQAREPRNTLVFNGFGLRRHVAAFQARTCPRTPNFPAKPETLN
jgi:hypothetical protein